MKKLRGFFVFSLVFILFAGAGYIISKQSNHNLNASENATTRTTQETESTASEQYNLITKITLPHTSISITKGKKRVIKADFRYGSNSNLENEPFEWKSKNTDIVTINKKGIIKAKKAGKTYIICSSISGNIKVRCKVMVREPYNKVVSMKLNTSHIHLGKNHKRTITPIIKYGNSKYSKEPIMWTSSNNKIASVKNGVIKGKKNGTTYINAKSKYTNKAVRLKVTVKNTKYIAVTFDDGPGDYTDKLLDALEKYHSKATFFVLGNRVSTYKKQLKREYNLGMEVGSHTWAHKNLNVISKNDVKSEIFKARDAVKNIIGEFPTLLRPPYGNFNKTVSKNAGVPMIYWSVDTEDWKHKNVKYISKYILNHARDGEIILLHDIHSTSVDGFIKALPKLKKKGFELVTVSELYEIYGKKLKKGIMYYGPNSSR